MAPGDSTVVELIFKTRGYKTKMSKYATIYSNDPDQPTAKIHLSAQVDATPDTTLPFTLSLDRVNFTTSNKKCKITLTNTGDSKLRIERAGADLDGLALKIGNDDPKPGKESELKFEWEGAFEKENVERSITFFVRGPERDSTIFSLPVFIQGTDPSPVPATAKSKSRTGGTAGSKSTAARKPARRSAAAGENPQAVKAGEAVKSETTPAAVDTLSVEKKAEGMKSEPKPDENR